MTNQNILVGVAWPYVNGEKHIGQIAGAYLPPDIFARYQRLAGNRVLMVSGSDTHGTPITLQAEKEGVAPEEIIRKYHQLFVDGCLAMGLTFDLYTHTDTQNHWDVTQQMFLTHLENGYVYQDVQQQLFDPEANRFLADRYVEGTCPVCGFEDARGDQCDNCGSLYDALELKNPHSKITGNTDLEVRETEHFFLDMAKMNEPLIAYLGRQGVLAAQRAQLYARPAGAARAARSPHHARHRLGHSHSARRLRQQAHLRLVRCRDWLPERGHRMECAGWGMARSQNGVATVVGCDGQPRRAHLQLYRQGQYPLPHHYLARYADWLQRR